MIGKNLYHYEAHITKVYDGDTITATISLGFGVELKNQKIRLFGINAPELRGSERDAGLKSKDWLLDKLLDKTVVIETIKDKKGKYGRWLGIVWLEDTNINKQIILEGFAKEYE